jgi:hypothetical protein
VPNIRWAGLIELSVKCCLQGCHTLCSHCWWRSCQLLLQHFHPSATPTACLPLLSPCAASRRRASGCTACTSN